MALERQFDPSTEKYQVDQQDLLINEAEVAVDEEDSDSDTDATDDDAAAEPTTPAKKRRSRGVRYDEEQRRLLLFYFSFLVFLNVAHRRVCLVDTLQFVSMS